MGKSIFFEHFKSLDSLVETIENRQVNSVFKNRADGLASQNKSKSEYEFYQTKDYSESREFLEKGWKKPLEDLKREIVKITRESQTDRKRLYNDFMGFVPNVPNTLKGHPHTMINREKRVEKSRTIHLLYGFSAIGSTPSKDLIKGGSMFLALVNSLERDNYRVKIDILRCTTANSSDAIGYTCTVKEYTQNMNLLKLCYPLVHPSMLRRTSFKWSETCPNITNREYARGYGVTLFVRLGKNSEQEREFLQTHNIIKKDMFYCNVYEAMECKNVNELAKKMGLQ